MAEMTMVFRAEADASIVHGGDICGEHIEWDHEGTMRSGPCTFAKDHEGDHSKP